jgi:hypothetical protein
LQCHHDGKISMAIPARLHFCWIGPRLPWAYVFAILSAAERSELPDIILHHTDPLEEGPELHALRRAPGVRLSHTDPMLSLAETGTALGVGERLAALYQRQLSPVKQADILRAAILYQEGGIYLDLDTVTTASLQPLLDLQQFVGSEFIVWPQVVRKSRSPLVWLRSLGLDLARKALRQAPDGWKVFRRIERFYFCGVNNAVMGAQPASALLARYLRLMLDVPPARQAAPYALGPNLLQVAVDGYGRDDLTVLPPHLFYPLPPEISEHWFRIRRSVRLDEVLPNGNRVAHWYASVRTRSRVAEIDPAYVRRHRKHQFYSALVCACIRDIP